MLTDAHFCSAYTTMVHQFFGEVKLYGLEMTGNISHTEGMVNNSEAARLLKEGTGPVRKKALEAGLDVSNWVLQQWITKGRGGACLEAIRYNSRWHTSVPAIHRFLDEQNRNLRNSVVTGQPTPKAVPVIHEPDYEELLKQAVDCRNWLKVRDYANALIRKVRYGATPP